MKKVFNLLGWFIVILSWLLIIWFFLSFFEILSQNIDNSLNGTVNYSRYNLIISFFDFVKNKLGA